MTRPALGRLGDAGEHLQQRALARAVAADEPSTSPWLTSKFASFTAQKASVAGRRRR